VPPRLPARFPAVGGEARQRIEQHAHALAERHEEQGVDREDGDEDEIVADRRGIERHADFRRRDAEADVTAPVERADFEREEQREEIEEPQFGLRAIMAPAPSPRNELSSMRFA